MREILFRGKRVDNGEWIEGVPIKTYDTEIGINLPLRYKAKNITLMNNDRVELCCAMDESAYFDTENYPIIDDETIGQYTGLKDVHGTRIFEGDIVKSIAAWYAVEFENGGYGLRPFGKGELIPIMGHGNFNENEVEVVGNVYDNQEILKGLM